MVEKLLDLLKDETCFDDLPPQAFLPELEKRLSPICLDKGACEPYFNDYGTKTHTIVLVDANNHVSFIEVERYLHKNGEFTLSEDRIEIKQQINL